MASRQVVQWLERTYPKPQVDPEWLDACYSWIITECHLNPATDFDKIKQNVESQLLQSDLRDSMVPGTGLPADVSGFDNTSLHGPPILVEIVSMTEIGHSAFSLQNTRQTRLDATDLAVLASEEATTEDGTIPNYPRSMLRFELSDGSTTFQAMEYRALPELQLGVTPLGYKMLLKDVFIRRGIGFLEPKCVVMKGHQTQDREACQDDEFMRGLRLRLGHPESDPDDDLPPPNPAPPQPPTVGHNTESALTSNTRSPFRELSESPKPVQPPRTRHDDDENQPRRRRIPNPPSLSGATLVGSRYFSGKSSTATSTQAVNADRSALLARERLFSPTRASLDRPSSSSSTSIDPNESIRVHPGGLELSSSDFGDDNIIMDDDFLAQLTRAETEALNSKSTSGPSSTSSGRAPSFGPSGAAAGATGQPSTNVVEVITIDDDEEEDKENVPLPTRHVRRRTAVNNVIDISD